MMGKGILERHQHKKPRKLLHEQSLVCMLAGKYVLNFTMIYDIV